MLADIVTKLNELALSKGDDFCLHNTFKVNHCFAYGKVPYFMDGSAPIEYLGEVCQGQNGAQWTEEGIKLIKEARQLAKTLVGNDYKLVPEAIDYEFSPLPSEEGKRTPSPPCSIRILGKTAENLQVEEAAIREKFVLFRAEYVTAGLKK